MSGSDNRLPRWDMSVVFPSLTSPEYVGAMQSLSRNIDDLTELFDRHLIGQQLPRPLDGKMIRVFEAVLDSYNQMLEQAGVLRAYISGFTTTDSRDEVAQAQQSQYQNITLQFALLEKRLTAWIGSIDLDTLIERSAVALGHQFILRQLHEEAQHLMSPVEEELATQLTLSGGSAWSQLHGTYSSQLTIHLESEEGDEELSVSTVRNFAYHPDREIRRWAYEGELALWEKAAVPLAACLNGVKGEVITLAKRRDWTSPLEASLFDNGIDRATLDAMMEAAYESFADFRRYLKAKATILGLETLTWYDLFAPVNAIGRHWSYDEAKTFITEHFYAYSDRMGDLAVRAFRENWIDAKPRPGKRDGAFCMRLRGGESRILANFKPSYTGVSTLAHELGHAYHGAVLANRTPLQRSYPMTLAETASIFCETLVRKAALTQVDPHEQFNILESSLIGSCQMVVDITSRFLFEQRLFERRTQRELGVSELNELMVQTQRETYGSGLQADTLHPYMWAAKSHYYRASLSFYNYPYMFGLLFGLGLYAHYVADPAAFRAGYDDLLSSTGLAAAADLAARFDIDIHSVAFWRSSFDVIRSDIDQFLVLAAENSLREASPI